MGERKYLLTVGGGGEVPESALPASVASVSSPGSHGYNVFPVVPDYVANVVGSGIGLVNTKTGNVDYSTSSGDHAAVVQQAVNALHPAAGARGGVILFKGGTAQFATQLVVPVGVCLDGGGPLALGSENPTIFSTYNGSAIVVTGDGSNVAYSSFRNLILYGELSQTSQNGIEWNSSGGGNIQDVFLDHVCLFNIGQDSFYINGASVKIWMNRCYSELAGRHGINHNASSSLIFVDDCYLTGNSGHGYYGQAGAYAKISGGMISSNGKCGLALGANSPGSVVNGVVIQGNTQQGIQTAGGAGADISGCTFSNNGGTSYADIDVPYCNAPVVIVGNAFHEGRSPGSNVTNFITGGETGGLLYCAIAGNVLQGTIQGNIPIAISSHSTNRVVCKNNQGFNDTYGKIPSFRAFYTSTARIGPFSVNGGTTTIVASTTYLVEGCDLMVNFSGGTGVSITIADASGNTVQSGLSSYVGTLPLGYGINFGAFSAAPTVNYIGVI
jgi:hypothetical protein